MPHPARRAVGASEIADEVSIVAESMSTREKTPRGHVVSLSIEREAATNCRLQPSRSAGLSLRRCPDFRWEKKRIHG
jgi:hypothetical protein